QRMTFAESMRRFGVDRPDLRFGLEIRDATELFAASGFRAFAAAAKSAGVVRGFVIPGAAGVTRSQTDLWSEAAKKLGLPGILTLRKPAREIALPAHTELQH